MVNCPGDYDIINIVGGRKREREKENAYTSYEIVSKKHV